MQGFVDAAADRIYGWAQDADSPEEPVALDVLANGQLVLCILANAYRADLRLAGIGSGCYAFDVLIPTSPDDAIMVRRSTDAGALGYTDAAKGTLAA